MHNVMVVFFRVYLKQDWIQLFCTKAENFISYDSIELKSRAIYNVIFSMSKAIENAAAICCFITLKYQSSPYCKKEVLYAQNCKKTLILCLMDADPTWRSTEWLGYAVIDIMYIDFRDLLRSQTYFFLGIGKLLPQSSLPAPRKSMDNNMS